MLLTCLLLVVSQKNLSLSVRTFSPEEPSGEPSSGQECSGGTQTFKCFNQFSDEKTLPLVQKLRNLCVSVIVCVGVCPCARASVSVCVYQKFDD